MREMRRLILLGVFAGACAFAQGAEFPPAAHLESSRAENSGVEITVRGEEGCSYILESGAALGGWGPVITNSIANGAFSYKSGFASSAFFRAVALLSTRLEGGSWLFDGRSFAGWNGDTSTLFRIEACAIKGGSLATAISQNQFLCTDRVFTNFVLRLKCKLVGVAGSFINSGVQFRSRRTANSVAVSGYQADMGDGYWGSLYDEARRNAILAAADPGLIARVLRSNDWNEYTIRAEGPRIRLYLNDELTVDYTEANGSIDRSGIIGFQVHQGGLAESFFKDVLLIDLP